MKNKEELLKEYKKEYDEIMSYKDSNKQYYDRVYINIPITKLEKEFFIRISKKLGYSQTSLIKRVLFGFMKKYPSILDEAKKAVNENVK